MIMYGKISSVNILRVFKKNTRLGNLFQFHPIFFGVSQFSFQYYAKTTCGILYIQAS